MTQNCPGQDAALAGTVTSTAAGLLRDTPTASVVVVVAAVGAVQAVMERPAVDGGARELFDVVNDGEVGLKKRAPVKPVRCQVPAVMTGEDQGGSVLAVGMSEKRLDDGVYPRVLCAQRVGALVTENGSGSAAVARVDEHAIPAAEGDPQRVGELVLGICPTFSFEYLAACAARHRRGLVDPEAFTDPAFDDCVEVFNGFRGEES